MLILAFLQYPLCLNHTNVSEHLSMVTMVLVITIFEFSSVVNVSISSVEPTFKSCAFMCVCVLFMASNIDRDRHPPNKSGYIFFDADFE